MSLDAILSALQAAQAVASGSPIPGLGIAVSVAVSLLTTLKSTKHSTSECKHLAQHAAQLTLGMYLQLRSATYHPVDQQVILIIDEHASTLREIESYMVKIAKRSLIVRMIYSGKMREDLVTYRAKLDAASRLFETRALVHVMNRVSDLSKSHSSRSRSSLFSSCRDSISTAPPIYLPPPRPEELAPPKPPPAPRATLKKPDRKASQPEIRSPKPPSRKLSREHVPRPRRANSNHEFASLADHTALTAESDMARLEEMVMKASRNAEQDMIKRERKLMREAFSSIQHSKSHSDIMATHRRMLSAIDELEAGAFPEMPYMTF